jgi:hypothetical protein
MSETAQPSREGGIREFAVDPAVSPRLVFPGQLQHL